MQVSVGDDVRRGQVLFEDKKLPGVRHTAPAAGTVRAVHRGDRRALRSVVIEMSPAEMAGRSPAEATFRSFSGRHPTGLTPDEVVELLTESGLWTSLRERPFGHVATPQTRPHSMFVTAVDTNPMAPPLDVVMQDTSAPFELGLVALTRLTDGPVFVCTGPETPIPIPTLDRVHHEQFSGPHPSGTPGFHIHRLDPVDRQKTVWHIGVQDVVAVGRLFETGSLDVRRIVALVVHRCSARGCSRHVSVRPSMSFSSGSSMRSKRDRSLVLCCPGARRLGRWKVIWGDIISKSLCFGRSASVSSLAGSDPVSTSTPSSRRSSPDCVPGG